MIKIIITDDEGTVWAELSTAEEQEDFDNDPMCKKEGITMSYKDAVTAVLETAADEAQRLYEKQKDDIEKLGGTFE